MTTNNSSKSEVTNITNQIVKCECNNHHNLEDFEGAWRVGCQQGAERERERIIKLLEQENPCQMKGMHHDIGFCSCLAIALIKGEEE